MLYKGVMDAQNRSQLANELMLYHMQVIIYKMHIIYI